MGRTLAGQGRNVRYTHALEAALLHGESDDRRRGRLNCISNMLDPIDYEDVLPDPIELPPPERADYRRPPRGARTPIVGK